MKAYNGVGLAHKYETIHIIMRNIIGWGEKIIFSPKNFLKLSKLKFHEDYSMYVLTATLYFRCDF